MKIKQLIRGIIATALFLLSTIATAGFPDDFSDVIWIDPDISSFPVTATISADVVGSKLRIPDTKRSVWPRKFHSVLRNDCCNRSLWIFVKLNGQWYASTFEYMRFNQVDKNAEAVNGRQIKRAPFNRSGYEWHPAAGEVYGFMTSGMARFDLNNLNVRERSNIALYRWGVGPTDNVDFEESARGPDGRPINGDLDPEECVEPTPPSAVNNTHTYTGSATGTLVSSGAVNSTNEYAENISIIVKDDRSLTFNVDDQSFTSRVAADGSFAGTFTLDILGQCNVDVNVNGNINGTTSLGTANGSDSCLGSSVVLTANYNATSPTAPSFLDQRPISRPARTCPVDFSISPLLKLLLDK